jgi:hypothetical protein
MCPGFVKTDMAGGVRKTLVSWLFWLASVLVAKQPCEGADTAVFLAIADGVEAFDGRFVTERQASEY